LNLAQYKTKKNSQKTIFVKLNLFQLLN